MADVKIIKEENLKGYTLIEGFPGIGLIGTIATSYLAEKMKMKEIGYVYSEKFPPVATVLNGMPLYPVRVYADKKRKIAVVFSDFVIPSFLVYPVARSIVETAKKDEVKEIISLAGMTSTFIPKKREVYAIATSEEIKKKLEKFGVKFIQEGVTTGVSGILLVQCALEKLPAFSLLAESRMGYPDPGAAAFLLKKLGEYLGVEIETEVLEKEARDIQERLQKTIQQAKAGNLKYKQAEEHLPMYG